MSAKRERDREKERERERESKEKFHIVPSTLMSALSVISFLDIHFG